jgi:putative heme-binding domain-containing protein
MCLQFNKQGDLFATDQEGATWLPNGNPFDELLHLQPGRHYGFPPRHPQHLPGVIDEPSVFDYAPQHQSLCGFRFNETHAARQRFGPAWWEGDALLAGFTRGKLYRTKLINTPSGYVAQNQLLANLQMMAADLSISPTGDLTIACHSGQPDWGTGPSGAGALYKIRCVQPAPPLPSLFWSAGPGEFRVAFDQSLDLTALKSLSKNVQISAGRAVSAGDRFETLRPGYQVVKLQQAFSKHDIPVLSATVSTDRRTLLLATPPTPAAMNYALTIRGLRPVASGLPQEGLIDMQTDLCGLAAQWSSADGQSSWSGWLPHLDLHAAGAFTSASAEHARLRELWGRPGKLMLTGELDLWNMLRPAVQPNSKLDYEPSVEQTTIVLKSNRPMTAIIGQNRETMRSTPADGGRHQLNFTAPGVEQNWLPYEITLESADGPPELEAGWFTNEDARWRAFPLRRFLLPWARPVQNDEPALPKRELPQLAGGDWERGRQVFLGDVANCHKCHQLRGAGAKIGPDLSNLIHRDYDSVLRDIRQPNAAINPDYLAYTVVRTDGRVANGLIHAEAAASLTLADVSGKLVEIPRDEIEEIKPAGTSVMPEGLIRNLSEGQLKDLLTFLLTDPGAAAN